MSKKEKKKDGDKKGKKKLAAPPVTPAEDIPAPESTPATELPKPTLEEAKPAAEKKPKKAPAKAKEPKAAKPKAKAEAKPKAPKKEKEIVISNDDIALRAYFIAERRQTFGWPGDETGDWVEAERQLREEAKKKA